MSHRRPPRPLPHRVQSTCGQCGAQTWAGILTLRCDDCAPSGNHPPRLFGWLDANTAPAHETTLSELEEAAHELTETLEVDGVGVASSYWHPWRKYL